MFKSLYTLLAAFVLIVAGSPESIAATYRTAQNGNFSSGSTWIGGAVPPSGGNHRLIINHTVSNLNSNFQLGVNNGSGSGSITVNSGASLTGTGAINLIGTDTIKNNGTFTLGALNVTKGPSVIAGGNNTVFTGNMEITGNGGLTVIPMAKLYVNGTTNFPNNANATFIVNGFYEGGKAGVTNYKSFSIQDALITVGSTGILRQYGTVNVDKNGTVVINRLMRIFGDLNLTQQTSTVTNNDSLIIHGNLNNKGTFTTAPQSYTEVRGAVDNQNSHAVITTNGYMRVLGDFYNQPNAIVQGDGGSFIVLGYSENKGTIRGTPPSGQLNFCDSTKPTQTQIVNDNRPQGSIANTVANCGSGFFSPVPVELLFVNANREGNQVVLNWATASEINNDFFSIERSFDGIAFETVGLVRGAGTTAELKNYRFTDVTATCGMLYYRLRQTDFNGENTASQVMPIAPCGSAANPQMSLFPNPGSEGATFSLALNLQQAGEFTLNVTDMAGRVVYTTQFNTNQGTSQTQLSGMELSKGIYTVSLLGSNMAQHSRLMVR